VSGAFAVDMQGITKRFGVLVANRDVSFAARRGEIHALVGENGAGKTTLMNILFGMQVPDAGRILLDGKEVAVTSPAVAIAHGLGMVHQHFKLVPSLTVAENVALGHEPTRRGLIDRRTQEAELRVAAERAGLVVDPSRPVRELSVGAQQRVEILKALARGARTVILDEPTAVLTPQESRDLFRTLRGFTAKGMTVILISHHLDEVLAVSDTATVLRDGAVIGTVAARDIDEARLAQMMVGRAVTWGRRARSGTPGVPLLRLDRVHARDDRGLPALRDVSLEVRAGEIVAVAGVDGNGQAELAEVVAGLRPPSYGRLEVAGRDVTGARPDRVREAGLAHVPADRLARGVDARASIAANVLMGRHGGPPFVRWGFVRWSRVREEARALIRRFDIRAPGPDAPVRSLSGGNMQKVVIAREVSQGKPVLLIDQPTRGVDIGATEAIHDEILRRRAEGAAILLVSVQLDECLALADRLLVIFGGRIVADLDPARTDAEQVGLHMMGAGSQRRAG
jgi:simple sugar transport system ATP-binding protein